MRDERRPGGEPTDEQISLTVAAIWREERVSCPHPDLLRSFVSGALGGGAAEFIDFHLVESECPYCGAIVEDIRAQDRDSAEADPMEGMRDRLLRSTVGALRASRG